MSEFSHGGHGGGEASGFSQNMGSHGHNFVNHLFGLDHEAHGHGAPGHPAPGHGGPVHPGHQGNHGGHGAVTHPSQMIGWSSALQALNLSNWLQGIAVTPNFLFLLLFGFLIFWLFVVYWIRHNEPLANQVLGSTGACQSRQAFADRHLLGGIKEAFPVKTTSTTGEVYVPNQPPLHQHAQFGMPEHHYGAGASAAAQAAENPFVFHLTPPAAQPYPAAHPIYPAGEQYPTHQYPVYDQPTYHPNAARELPTHAYMVPVYEANSTRVKMIVNR